MVGDLTRSHLGSAIGMFSTIHVSSGHHTPGQKVRQSSTLAFVGQQPCRLVSGKMTETQLHTPASTAAAATSSSRTGSISNQRRSSRYALRQRELPARETQQCYGAHVHDGTVEARPPSLPFPPRDAGAPAVRLSCCVPMHSKPPATLWSGLRLPRGELPLPVLSAGSRHRQGPVHHTGVLGRPVSTCLG